LPTLKRVCRRHITEKSQQGENLFSGRSAPRAAQKMELPWSQAFFRSALPGKKNRQPYRPPATRQAAHRGQPPLAQEKESGLFPEQEFGTSKKYGQPYQAFYEEKHKAGKAQPLYIFFYFFRIHHDKTNHFPGFTQTCCGPFRTRSIGSFFGPGAGPDERALVLLRV
jgi:hypothetical protein